MAGRGDRPPVGDGSTTLCPHLEPQQVGGQQLEQLEGLAVQLVVAQDDAGGVAGPSQEGQQLHQQSADGTG